MTDAIGRSALLEVFSDSNSKRCEFLHYGIIKDLNIRMKAQ